MKIKYILAQLITTVVLLSAMNSSAATSYTFNGSASGLWNVNANWTPSTGFPVAGDTAIIPTTKSVTGLGGANQACATLTIQGTGSLTVDANTLAVSGTATVGSSGIATLTVSSGATMTAGTLSFGTTTSTIQNNGTMSIGADGGSAGTLTQGANASFTTSKANGSAPGWTIVATASGNTFTYSGSGPAVKATTYYNLSFTSSSSSSYSWNSSIVVNGTLTAGGGTAAALNNVQGTFGAIVDSGAKITCNGAITISGDLNISGGTTFYAQSGLLTVSGATAANGGTLQLGNAGAFTGDVSITGTGVYNNSGNGVVTFAGNLTFSGTTFTSGSGVNTFSGANKTITGTLSIPKLTINGTITNAGALTVSTALAGSGTLTQNANSALSIGGTSSGLTLAASANTPNTVSYTSSSAQAVLGANYDSLTVSGASAKTLGGNSTVGGTLTLTAGTLNLSGNTLSAGSITRTSGSILLAVTAPTVTKVYDGTTTAGTVMAGTLSGFVTGQTVTATGTGSTYSSANVGSSYANTVAYTLADGTGGGLAVNYSLANSVIANAAITKAPLSITAPTVTKTYNGSTTAGTVAVGTLSGFVGTQTVTATGTGSAYASANVGSAYANIIAYTLANGANGGLAGNYSLASSVIANAAITPKPLAITAPTVTKVYDGGTIAGTVTAGTLSGFVGSETVTVSAASGTAYSSANVGSSYANTVAYTLADGASGGLAANYSLANSVIANAAITKAPLSITAPTVTKVYDGTMTSGMVTVGTLSGFVGSETVTATGAATAYSSANVSSVYSSTISYSLADGDGGGLAANYSLADSVIADAAITPATPVVAWSNPADIAYGTALDGTQLNATAGGVAGTFGYTPLSGTVLNVGANQTLSVQFTPDDTTNYNTPSATTVSINVNPASSGISFGVTTEFIYNGTAQTPSIRITGSTGAQSTNYVGIAPTSYGPSEDAPTNAGTYGLTNTLVSDINYIGATNGLTFTIDPTNLTVTAQPNTKSYDGTTSAAVVPTITAGSLQGTDTASFTETYDTPDVGTGKTLTPAGSVIDGNGGNNYSVTFVDDSTGVINSANVFTLISSENPSGNNDSLFFTATNLPVDATSNVVFEANGIAFSTNDVIIGGATSLAITNLPRGDTNIIIATYNGDNTYAPVTTSLTQAVTNHPPIAAVMTVQRTAGLSLMIALSDVATNWSDADGDTVTLTGVNLVTTNGVNLETNSSWILYPNSPNVNDQISYGISDGVGGTNIGYINIEINNSVTGTNSITSITVGNTTVVTAYGIPGYNYILERATNLAPAVWVDVITNSAATNGVISAADAFLDLGGISPESAYYRLKWQP